MFPGTVWRAFETGVLDNAFLQIVMRRALVMHLVCGAQAGAAISFGKNMVVYDQGGS